VIGKPGFFETAPPMSGLSIEERHPAWPVLGRRCGRQTSQREDQDQRSERSEFHNPQQTGFTETGNKNVDPRADSAEGFVRSAGQVAEALKRALRRLRNAMSYNNPALLTFKTAAVNARPGRRCLWANR
jgi:hypothetical protein